MKQMIVIIGFTVCLSACSERRGQEVKNPFLAEYATPFQVPPFDQIKLEHYMPAFLQGMEEQRKEIEVIVNRKAPANFENTIVALDQSGELLRKVNGVFGNQNSAFTSLEMQELNKDLSPLLSKHRDDINLNPGLFAKVKSIYEKRATLNLDAEQAKLLEETYKRFERGGANLDAAGQEKLRDLNSKLSLLEITFGQNMLQETNAYQLVIEKAEDLSGLPQDLVAAAAEAAGKAGKPGKWLFTLHNPSIMPFLQFSDRRELREHIFKGYINRGNNNNDADNKAVVKQLVELRLEKANVLGYPHYAAYVLEDRMAKNEGNVMDLLEQVWKPALAKATAEYKDLQELMKKESKEKLQGWDWRYYSEKVKQARYDLDENLLRPYLKLESVLNGIFYVANCLYGVTFTEVTGIPVPHPEATAFECKDKDGTHLGILYFDFFPRESKRGGAWCSSYRTQSYEKGKRITPVVTIVCNFSRPAGNSPALLSPDEVETMFHEFGHALHSLFKDVRYYGVSSVPRDFVELPSQIMEHWAFEPEVLKVYAKHYQTGEVLPADLIRKLEQSGKYGQGFATAEYVQASVLDMRYHMLREIPADFEVLSFESAIMKDMKALEQIPPRYRSTYFNHTMGGGYTAGYYSYMWSEGLDADAYDAFVETGDLFDQATAKRFRDHVLSRGGIEDAQVMYRNFRGKDPNVASLLRYRGLDK